MNKISMSQAFRSMSICRHHMPSLKHSSLGWRTRQLISPPSGNWPECCHSSLFTTLTLWSLLNIPDTETEFSWWFSFWQKWAEISMQFWFAFLWWQFQLKNHVFIFCSAFENCLFILAHLLIALFDSLLFSFVISLYILQISLDQMSRMEGFSPSL